MSALPQFAGFKRREKIQALAPGRQCSMGKNVARIRHHPQQLISCGHPHRDEVLLVAGSGNGIDRRGCDHTLFSLTSAAAVACASMNPEFSPAPGGCKKCRQPFVKLGIHQSLQPSLGDACQCTQRNRQEVEREGQRLAVKIASGQDLPLPRPTCGLGAPTFLSVGNQLIVHSRVHLDFEDMAAVRQGVAYRAVYLGDAAQGIGILHLAAITMRLADGTVLEHAAQVLATCNCPAWGRAR